MSHSHLPRILLAIEGVRVLLKDLDGSVIALVLRRKNQGFV
ncbi:MAG: hypothetical protein LZF62_170004 [Nitrospira sp.]|nr:MAG: hypothetical protein LZF62_170004 [Nitrospira sp.]